MAIGGKWFGIISYQSSKIFSSKKTTVGLKLARRSDEGPVSDSG